MSEDDLSVDYAHIKRAHRRPDGTQRHQRGLRGLQLIPQPFISPHLLIFKSWLQIKYLCISTEREIEDSYTAINNKKNIPQLIVAARLASEADKKEGKTRKQQGSES